MILIILQMTYFIKSLNIKVPEAVRAPCALPQGKFPVCFAYSYALPHIFGHSSRQYPGFSGFEPIQPFSCSFDTGNQRDVPL